MRNQGNQGKRVKKKGRSALRAAVGVIAFAMLFFFPFGQEGAGTVYGAGKRTVRVAFFPMGGYHETLADGSFSEWMWSIWKIYRIM